MRPSWLDPSRAKGGEHHLCSWRPAGRRDSQSNTAQNKSRKSLARDNVTGRRRQSRLEDLMSGAGTDNQKDLLAMPITGLNSLFSDYMLRGATRNSLDFCVWNCRGLACRSNNMLLENDFLNVTQNADTILLSETWSSEEQDIHLDGYRATICHRENILANARWPSGGIAAFVKEDVLDLVEVIKTVGDLYLWLKIKTDDHYLFVAFLYIPPGSLDRDQTQDNVFDLLMRDIVSYKFEYGQNSAFGTCGDTNLHTGLELDLVRDNNTHFVPLFNEYSPEEELERFSKDEKCKPKGCIRLHYCQETGQRILKIENAA